MFQSVGELDELREVARGASLEIVQLGAGTMRGMLAHVDLGPSSIHTNCFSLPARGRGSLSADRWTFVIFPRGVEGQFNSQPLDADRMLVYPPGAEFEGTIAGHFQDWVFTAEFHELADLGAVVAHRDFRDSSGGVVSLAPDSQKLECLRDFARNTMSLMQASPHLLADEFTRKSLHAQLMNLLSQTVLSALPERRRRRVSHVSHWRIVREAEDFLRSHLSEPIFVSDLCSVTDASERTVRSAFLNVVGVSPNAYLKTIRLNRVRTQLEQSSPEWTTVTSVAARWGFVHLARFAQDYRRFFGELPSETLRRVRTEK